MACAEAGRHCTVQSITPPWAGRSGLMHSNHLGAYAAFFTCMPVLEHKIVGENRYVPICLINPVI